MIISDYVFNVNWTVARCLVIYCCKTAYTYYLHFLAKNSLMQKNMLIPLNEVCIIFIFSAEIIFLRWQNVFLTMNILVEFCILVLLLRYNRDGIVDIF